MDDVPRQRVLGKIALNPQPHEFSFSFENIDSRSRAAYISTRILLVQKTMIIVVQEGIVENLDSGDEVRFVGSGNDAPMAFGSPWDMTLRRRTNLFIFRGTTITKL
jgi:hypothetical protein